MLLLLFTTACSSLTCGPGTVEVDDMCLPENSDSDPAVVDTETGISDTSTDCEPADVWGVSVENDPDLVTQSELGVFLDGVGEVQVLCELTTPPPTWETWVTTGTTWRYLDSGIAPTEDWREPEFDDSDWSEGPSPLGYGENEATEVNWGPDEANKYTTTWFRASISLSNVTAIEEALLQVYRDDGVIVTLNGVEVLRDNLPEGTVEADTLGLNSISGSAETTPVEATLDPALLVEGDNLFAVEVHQASLGSSDLAFDLQLLVTLPPNTDDTGELHALHSAEPAPAHIFQLQGLLAEATYTCTATPSCPTTTEPHTFTVATSPLPASLPTLVTTQPATENAWGSYALLNHGRPCGGDDQNRLLIIDHEGRIRWYLELEGLDQTSTIDLESQYLGGGRLAWGGGDRAEGSPQIVDLSGRILYTAAYPDAASHVYHHDIEYTGEERILGLINTDDVQGPVQWEGFALIEHDPVTLEVTWEWYSQDAVTAGELLPDGSRDPWHANALAAVTDEQGEAVYVAFLNTNEIIRIDRATKAISWHLGVDRDFALVDPSGAPLDSDSWFSGLHAIDVDEEGHVMVYDNGWLNESSRGLEFQLDTDNFIATLSWSYAEDNWYEPVWGDADALENGNHLINMSHNYCMGGTRGHMGALLELDPTDNTPLWRVEFTDEDDASYRSQKLDACEIFANATLCPELLD